MSFLSPELVELMKQRGRVPYKLNDHTFVFIKEGTESKRKGVLVVEEYKCEEPMQQIYVRQQQNSSMSSESEE